MDERMKTERIRWFLCSVFSVFPLIVSAGALPQAAAGSRGVPGITYITIRGNVIAPPPCVINNGNTVLVDFGEVMSTRIDGVRYRQPVNYSAECSKMPANAMTLAITGNAAGFDSDALRTEISGLGVRLLYQGRQLALGEKVAFTYPAFPVLEAVPVRDVSAVLTGGDFAATATLELDYQ